MKHYVHIILICLFCTGCALEGELNLPVYYIAYQANGGTGIMESSSHVYGAEKNLNANNFERSGYLFTGWGTSAGGPVVYKDKQNIKNLTKTNGKTVDVYAQWEKVISITYNISYNANGGGGTMENSAHTVGTPQKLRANTFTRTGYTFAGWAATPGGTVTYVDQESVSNLTQTAGATVTLYARWEGVAYYIAYHSNGGTGSMANSVHAYGAPQNLRASTFTRIGYSFAGWGISAAGPVMYADQQNVNNLATAAGETVTLYAQWGSVTASTYSVVYDRNGGTGTMENSVLTYGIAKTLSANTFTRSGYIFTGWGSSTAGPVVYGDEANVLNLTEIPGGTVILYAQWGSVTASTYSVVYDRNGGTGIMESSVHTIGVAKILTANAYTRTGYTFAGWGTSAAGPVIYGDEMNVLNLTETPGGTFILYAQWTVNAYTVVYDRNGGTGSMENSLCTYGVPQNLRPRTFTRTGYTFIGWALSADGPVVYENGESVVNLSAEAGSIVTLYAAWEGIHYTIAYNANGGIGSMEGSSFVYGTAQKLKTNSFFRTSYTFIGWAVIAGGPMVYADGQSVNNLAATAGATVTLYAKWSTHEMVEIQAGTFTMGSPDDEPGREPVNTKEGPQRQVTLTAFKMGKYEVTQEQYQALMGNNPSFYNKDPVTGEIQGKRPVETVSWYDAVVFCNKLSIAEGLSPAYRLFNSTNPNDWGAVPTSSNAAWNAIEIVVGSMGYRLPTEAQWEYACRAETTTAYNTGPTINNNTGWYATNMSGAGPHEVGKKPANAWGLYDMHGNVAEWCWDWYEIYPSIAEVDPVGAITGTLRVHRSFSFWYADAYLRSACRGTLLPSDQFLDLGFRLVRP